MMTGVDGFGLSIVEKLIPFGFSPVGIFAMVFLEERSTTLTLLAYIFVIKAKAPDGSMTTP